MAFQKIEGDVLILLHDGCFTPGTVVRFSPHARKLNGKTGIIDRFKTKRYAVIVDGQKWSIPPSIITEYDPDADGVPQLQQERQTPSVQSGSVVAWADDNVGVGDVVIFYRGEGSYDIAKVERVTPQGKPFCKVLNGRGRGKVYGFQRSWYVCKLPSERFDG